jgi:uncharacterized membrane protein|tara:strand:+ start:243 stop:734 length:492 start_codon:yes stop_codon:yes gene_type:complete
MTQGRSARAWWAQAFLVLTVAWLVTLVAVPFAMAHEVGGQPATVVSAGSYLVGNLICHQRSDRSFRLWGVQMPVCARCAGLYGGAAFGALVAGAWGSGRRRSAQGISTLRWVVLGAAVPTGASVAMEALGVFEGSAVIRAAGAIPLGAAVTWVVSLVIRGEFA